MLTQIAAISSDYIEFVGIYFFAAEWLDFIVKDMIKACVVILRESYLLQILIQYEYWKLHIFC